MRRAIFSFFAAFLLASPGLAQTVQQAGPWTQGHAPSYSIGGGSQPFVTDGGPASGSGANNPLREGLYVAPAPAGGGTPPYSASGTGPNGANWCDYDGPPSGGNFHYLCLSPNAQGYGLIAYGASGSAVQQHLVFSINGVLFDPLAVVAANSSLTFANHAALLGIVITQSGPANVISQSGYSQAGDGGWAVYDWNPTSTATADNIYVVTPVNWPGGSPGRYVIRQQNNTINVAAAGVKCDGASDDATALNAFFAAVQAGSGIVFPVGATCVFNAPLVLPSQSHVTIAFNGAQLLYKGGANNVDLVTMGTFITGCSLSYINIDNLWLNSATTMTAGDGLKLNSLCSTNVTRLIVDPQVGSNTPNTFWNAYHINGGGNVYTTNYHVKGQHIDEIDNGSASSQATNLFHYNGTAANGGGVGINIAGNCGGCYWDSFDAVNNTTGNVLIDQSQAAVQNHQVRFGPNFSSDGTPGYGITISDTGQPAGFPVALGAAVGSWSVGGTTITVAACPAVSVANTYLMDNTLVPPRRVAQPTSCIGGAITVGPAFYASAGATDSLVLGSGPAPGRTSEFFCEGCWISTATGNCLVIAANVQYNVNLDGARIKNCGASGLVVNSNLSRVRINGGDISQNVTGIENNAAGAVIDMSNRPTMYVNGGRYGGTAGLTPSIISNCGGTGASINGDDWSYHVGWGVTSETSCVIAYSFAHDNVPNGKTITPNADNYGYTVSTTEYGTTATFHANMINAGQFAETLSGPGF